MDGVSYEYTNSRSSGSHGYLHPSISAFMSDVPAGSVVMDAGCGNGSFISQFRGRGWQLNGADFSPAGIAIAKESFPDINFFLADGQASYKHLLGPVDAVISTEVIEHIYDPRAFLRSCFELLKPGGRIILSTPYHGYLKNVMLAITGKMDQHFTVLWDHGHIKFWSRKTLTQALAEAGFVDIEFAGSGRVPYVWKSMVLKAIKPSS